MTTDVLAEIMVWVPPPIVGARDFLLLICGRARFAEAAAIEAKAVYRCANHDDVLLTHGDAEANAEAYAIASNRAKEHVRHS